jgi:hypothetical protein
MEERLSKKIQLINPNLTGRGGLKTLPYSMGTGYADELEPSRQHFSVGSRHYGLSNRQFMN